MICIYVNYSNVNDTKKNSSIIHHFIFCFRFMKYCILLRTYLCAIGVQFRNQTKLCSNCVSIDLWGMRFSWLTFQQLWRKLGIILFTISKTNRLLVKYSTVFCVHLIVLWNWSNMEQFSTNLKKISRFYRKRTGSSF